MEDRHWPPGHRWSPPEPPADGRAGGAAGRRPPGSHREAGQGQPGTPGYARPAGPRTPRTPRTPQTPEPDNEPSALPAMAWTVGWFVLPVLIYVGWALTRPAVADPGCVDAAGDPCQAPRTEALAALVDNASELLGALALALLAAVALRRITAAWRSGTVGLASAVVGAGAATVLIAALG